MEQHRIDDSKRKQWDSSPQCDDMLISYALMIHHYIVSSGRLAKLDMMQKKVDRHKYWSIEISNSDYQVCPDIIRWSANRFFIQNISLFPKIENCVQ